MPLEFATGKVRLVLAFFSIYIIWGSTYLAIRMVLESFPPFLMASARFLLAGLILLFLARVTGTWKPSRRELLSCAFLGSLFLLCGNGAVVWAEERISSGLAALVVATEPLMVAAINGSLNRRVPSGRTLAGMVIGTLGLILLLNPSGSLRGETLGILAVVGGAAAWAIGSVAAPRLPLPSSSFASTAWQMLVGGLLLALAGSLHREWGLVSLSMITWKSALAWAYLVIFGSLVGFTSYTYLLKHASPERVATYAWVNPLVAVLLGAVIGGEVISMRTLVSGSLILLAVVLTTLPEGWSPRVPLPAFLRRRRKAPREDNTRSF